MKYTYTYSASISKALGLEHIEYPDLSDQYLDSLKRTDNYRTYGGGAAGPKNGHYGCKHSEEAKRLISESKRGKPAHNKGKANPVQSERWKTNNPMKDPSTAKKVVESRKKNNSWVAHDGCFKQGHMPHNYVDVYRTFSCETCGKSNTVRNVKDNKTKRFCNRSCQATFTNRNRLLTKP